MSQHTPGPWVACDPNGNFPRGIMTECGTCQLICEVADKWATLPFVKGTPGGNREFIIRAANNHDALVAKLTEALDYIRHGDFSNGVEHCGKDEGTCRALAFADEIQELLAKATQGKDGAAF